MDEVRAEVKRARKNAQRIAKRPNVDQPLKRVDETQTQWMNRRDCKEELELFIERRNRYEDKENDND